MESQQRSFLPRSAGFPLFSACRVLVIACGLLLARQSAIAATISIFGSSVPLMDSAYGVQPPGSTKYPSVGNDNSAKTYGYSFTVTSTDLRITHLGMFDANWKYPSAGLYQEHQVALWTAGGVLLAQARIQSGTGSTLEGMFRYATLDVPINLQVGTQYVLGAYYPQVSGFFIDAVVSNVYKPLAAPGFSLGTTRFQFGQNMPFPGTVTINEPYVGPTLKFETVPEPEAVMFLSGVTILSLVKRRKRLG